LKMGNGSVVDGDWSLGVLGNVGDAMGSGVTLIAQRDVDSKCDLFREMYVAIVGEEGMPPL
jgi:hypothetical protein